MEANPVTLEVDLVPAHTDEEISKILVGMNPKRTVSGYLQEVLPESLVAPFAYDASVDLSTTFANLDKKARNRIVNQLKGWQIGKVRHVPLEKGEVVAGGVDLSEVDPQTMQSKLISGLYLCGEILDIAGPVGGYNLQAAFATGYTAGSAATFC
jgi:predicted Rossmann fold flavoprotein